MTKQNRDRFAIIVVSIFFLASIVLCPITVSAWGDNSEEGRPSYTKKEIEKGILGDQIIFNTISNSNIGDEKNFVGARPCAMDGNRCLDAETNANPTPNTKWQGNNIDVEDGKTYTIRIYVHNNNPNGYDAVAENTRVSFSIPNEYDAENGRIQVNGFIKSSNATPSEYWDYVNFNSEVPFHLDYVYGSALLNNNKTQAEAAAGGYGDNAGWKLSDDIVKAKSVDGVLIGSDALDGKVPGCYDFANYVTIQVKAVFSAKFTVVTEARIVGSGDKIWRDSVDAKIGDTVEFRILYTNTSDKKQDNVAIKDILPSNLKYVKGSTILKNTSYPNGAYILNDSLVENGIRIGNYEEDGGNAMVYFKAKVVDEDLDQGLNILANWAQAGVGEVTIQDSVEIRVQNDKRYHIVLTVYGMVITLCLLVIVITIWKIMKRNNMEKAGR